jgi:hypothetical protein
LPTPVTKPGGRSIALKVTSRSVLKVTALIIAVLKVTASAPVSEPYCPTAGIRRQTPSIAPVPVPVAVYCPIAQGRAGAFSLLIVPDSTPSFDLENEYIEAQTMFEQRQKQG